MKFHVDESCVPGMLRCVRGVESGMDFIHSVREAGEVGFEVGSYGPNIWDASSSTLCNAKSPRDEDVVDDDEGDDGGGGGDILSAEHDDIDKRRWTTQNKATTIMHTAAQVRCKGRENAVLVFLLLPAVS